MRALFGMLYSVGREITMIIDVLQAECKYGRGDTQHRHSRGLYGPVILGQLHCDPGRESLQ